MANTQAAVIDADRYTVSRTVVVNATRAAVWRALTDPEHIAKWFGQTATLDALEVGARGTFGWPDHGVFPMVVTEVDEPNHFAYRWYQQAGEFDVDRATEARFTLVEEGATTVLTVVETGFDRISDDEEVRRSGLDGNRQGWDAELDELVEYLESAPA
ncbi:SRPBCC family protein [Rhodococcus sp. NPDC127528]|uniref:SRPBCC family protein n=1 Tax=unclassified Rhodococcus (in: high G+C Gram-positive bacteria) TaxID=192944 RepID=UPI00362EC3D8